MRPGMLVLFGAILLAACAAHAIGRRAHVPRVTLLLVLGAAVGPAFLNVIPPVAETAFPLVMHLALAMVGFLLGERLALRELRVEGRAVLMISLVVVAVTTILVALAVWLVAGDLPLALVLGGVASATDPAATVDVIRQFRAKGRLTTLLERVVAIDDAWCVILFSVLLVLAEAANGQGGNLAQVGRALWEVGGALLLGGLIGVPMAWLTGRVTRGEPTLLEAAGFVLLCAGLAQLLDVSYMLSSMALGAMVANRARHHVRPFRAIEGVSDPFLAIFFFLAGYRLDVAAMFGAGVIGVAYVTARTAGRVLGGYAGGRLSGAGAVITRHGGWCLLPQAGVALGLALLAAERIPDVGAAVLPVTIASTVFFEVAGPACTYSHLKRARELGKGEG